LIQNQVIPFLFYFLNQMLINLILSRVIFFNIKKHKPISYLPLGPLLFNFSKLIKKHKTN